MQHPDDEKNTASTDNKSSQTSDVETSVNESPAPVPVQDVMYKVYIGSYTSAEQAKVAKEIILESGSGLNPIVKCLGSNNFTLQVGIFKNKQSAETMLMTIQKTNLPGRIVQEN
jgi:cell division protein FtsN